jgi:formylglycine-generating enzyme required for sulfatase activity
MVPIGPFCIDRYEASRPDATTSEAGQDETRATSRPGVLPWVVHPMTGEDVTRFEAACNAAAKRLCTPDEWSVACSGPDQTLYVYGTTFDREACNCVDTYCDDYCQQQGILESSCNTEANCGYTYYCFHQDPTGTHGQCTNGYGTFDMNGNVWEVVPSSNDARGYELRGGAFNCASASARVNCTFNATWTDLYAGFRCCSDRPSNP